jgi:hypothetical protein
MKLFSMDMNGARISTPWSPARTCCCAGTMPELQAREIETHGESLRRPGPAGRFVPGTEMPVSDTAWDEAIVDEAGPDGERTF